MHRISATAAVATLAAVLAGCATTGSGGVSSDNGPAPLTKVTYLTGFAIQGQDAFVFLGKQKGFFARAGLDVDVQPGKGTGDNLKLLVGGRAQVAVLDLTGAILAAAHGQASDVRIISAIYQRTVSCITTLAGRRITHPVDLAGRTIGYQPGGVNYTLFPTYARHAGIDTATIHWQAIPPTQLVPALLAGHVDAITQTVLATPQVQTLAKNTQVLTLPYSDYLPDLYGNALAVARSTLTDQPDLVHRFQSALLASLAYATEHPDEAGQALTNQQPQYQANIAAAEFRAAVPYIHPTTPGVPIGAIDRQRLTRNITALHEGGAIPATINPDDLVS
jgi:NitT/TauT family transport system substrate-binding protein